MNKIQSFSINNEAVNSLLLEMAQQRTPEKLFHFIVFRLASFSEISLARIWILKPGDICANCPTAAECTNNNKCLHLVASDGQSVNGETEWKAITGNHRRFPLGARKVGHIAASAEPVVVESIKSDSKWIAHPEWAEAEGINGFAGQPMIFRGEVLGVLAIFTKTNLTPPVLDMLRVIADHAASALANAMAFEEIEQLKNQLEQENSYLREEISEVTSFGGLIGKSLALKMVLDQVELVAPTNASVLILGESGTGKELIARELHHRSLRHDKPMIKVNCASIPKDLFDSEFFGHAKGSFTGAISERAGRFNAAEGGTLFLDEIGEIPLDQQSKLLRVLQEGEYERVGEERTRKADVRIIAATNRNLEREVEAGRFREDLYFRLNVYPIHVPPLRDRKEDIEDLAEHFLSRALKNMNRPPIKLTLGHLQRLQCYDWPGNCRELQNIIERAAITSAKGVLHLDLPIASLDKSTPETTKIKEAIKTSILTEKEMQDLQKQNTLAALSSCKWKIYGDGGAAELLGVKPTTLTTRIKKMGLKKT